jgi:hypothetical protein
VRHPTLAKFHAAFAEVFVLRKSSVFPSESVLSQISDIGKII